LTEVDEEEEEEEEEEEKEEVCAAELDDTPLDESASALRW